MAVSIHVIDAFTDQPFTGNPSAVCLLSKPRDEAWMQAVAGEMNLAETAFLVHEGQAIRLRWFTPRTEVDLCGHATLAAAFMLWETHAVKPLEEIQFETRSGPLKCVRRQSWIDMDFPAEPAEEVGHAGGLLSALGLERALAIRKNRMDYLVEVHDEQIVRDLKPDMHKLAAVETRGVIVTAPSADSRYTFVSRFFAPAVGINEDPATGSAHCCLGPYWGAKLGITEMIGRQLSARGGTVRVGLRGPRVVLAGQAVMVYRAQFLTA